MTLDDDLAIAEKDEDAALAQIQVIKDQDADLLLKMRVLQEQLKELEGQRAVVNRPRWDHDVALRRAGQRKKEILQAISVAKEAERIEAEFQEVTANLEHLSRDAIWRTGNANGDTALKHQIDGAYLLASAKRAILADSMGVGKTLTAIAALDLIGARKILVVCPGEVMSGFAKEIGRWSRRPPIILGRQPKPKVRQMLGFLKEIDAPEYIHFINYEAWAHDRSLLIELQSMTYDTVICDEAHRIKETDTSAYRGVEQLILARNLCGTCGKFATFCPHTGAATPSVRNAFMLTGTPILNRPQEIYPLLHLLRPQDFDNKRAFMRQYCEVDLYTGKWGFRPGGMATLAQRLKGMYLRRTRETAGIHLPKQTIQIHAIDLDPEEHADQIDLLDQLAQHAQVEVDNGHAVGMANQLVLLTRQRQAATWAGHMRFRVPRTDPETGEFVYEPDADSGDFKQVYDLYNLPEQYWKSAKIDAVMDLLTELTQDGQRTVVFSLFKEALYEIAARCEASGIRAVEYHGDTKPALREEVKANFDRQEGEPAKWDAVLCHYKTGGVGLNFTAATQVIILDEEWNPGMNEQGYGRVDRIGQTEETTVHVFQTTETVDEWMSALNDEKRKLIGDFNGAVDNEAAVVDMLTHRRRR